MIFLDSLNALDEMTKMILDGSSKGLKGFTKNEFNLFFFILLVKDSFLSIFKIKILIKETLI